jgi:hypothetical protein
VCDIILRLDYRSIQDYYLRTIEVVKARFQSHVWGKHQLKVYPKLSLTLPAVTVADKEKLRHSHPYRKEGGIFIYPSIHYYLSRYKRIGPRDGALLLSAVEVVTRVTLAICICYIESLSMMKQA